MYQNILYEHVEINHLIIKVVVFGIAPVLFNLNYLQTQPRALNPSYAGIPVFRPKQDSLSSLRLSRVESSTSRKGSPSPAWSSAAVVKAYSSPLLQPQDQLGLQQPSMRTRRGDETSIRSSPAGHGDDDFRRIEVLLLQDKHIFDHRVCNQAQHTR